METSIDTISDIIRRMERQLTEILLTQKNDSGEGKLWKNTHIKHQIDRRLRGGTLDIRDHIRAMVYSMLSSGIT